MAVIFFYVFGKDAVFFLSTMQGGPPDVDQL